MMCKKECFLNNPSSQLSSFVSEERKMENFPGKKMFIHGKILSNESFEIIIFDNKRKGENAFTLLYS